VSEDRSVDDLSLAELEEQVERRRRVERARLFAEQDSESRFHPVTVEPSEDAPNWPHRASERAPEAHQRHWRDRLLLVIEIAAVLGLLAIIVGSLGSLQMLNDEVVQAQRAIQAQLPSSTTVAQPGLLPGSSLPLPNANLTELPGSSFPPEEVPPALGVNLQSSPSLPPPTSGPHSPTRIVISKLGIDWPIVEGDSWDQLKLGVGHHVGSANPGERGNVVLSGHDDVFGEVFKDLDKLENGDLVQVFAGAQPFRYQVRAKRTVAPTELSVLDPTREPVVTLLTCAPYRVDTMRLVVIAQLVP
jgi:sortase A